MRITLEKGLEAGVLVFFVRNDKEGAALVLPETHNHVDVSGLTIIDQTRLPSSIRSDFHNLSKIFIYFCGSGPWRFPFQHFSMQRLNQMGDNVGWSGEMQKNDSLVPERNFVPPGTE